MSFVLSDSGVHRGAMQHFNLDFRRCGTAVECVEPWKGWPFGLKAGVPKWLGRDSAGETVDRDLNLIEWANALVPPIPFVQKAGVGGFRHYVHYVQVTGGFVGESSGPIRDLKSEQCDAASILWLAASRNAYAS